MLRTSFLNVRNLLLLSIAGVVGLFAAEIGKTTNSTMLIEIDGQTFTVADVDRKNPGALFQARNAMFEAERKAADEFVANYLLEREAKKHNLSLPDFLEKHVYNGVPKEPSEDALRAYYDGLDIPQPFNDVREKIRETIWERRTAKAKTAYVKNLREQARVMVKIAAPRAPVNVDNTPLRGATNARVVVVEYGDYECPYCQQVSSVVDRLESEFNGKIAFAFKDVPLPMHASAQKAAEATHCAGAQGKYWEYHDLLFANKQLLVPQLKEQARALKLDGKQFDQCLESGEQAERVKKHFNEAQTIGLPGTPGFFVNGRFLSGAVDYNMLRQAIEEELAIAAPAAAGLRSDR